MTVLLLRPYAGSNAGVNVTYDAKTEAALIAQGLASNVATSATTTGAQTSNVTAGTAAVAAGSSSVVITNALINANSTVVAYVSQTTADTTFTSVLRVVPAAGSVTIFGPANATATTIVRWALLPAGLNQGV